MPSIGQELVALYSLGDTGSGTIADGSITLAKLAFDPATQAELDAVAAAKAVSLTTTAVKTAAYTAAVNELVPCNATSAGFTITLPTAPADKTRVIVKKTDLGTNAVTVACAGSDVLNRAGGPTTLVMPLPGQAATLQYATSGAIWYVTADDLPLAQIDTRYTAIAHATDTANPHSVTKAQVGLGSADNTADTAKPVSTAQQTALDLKAPLLGGIPGPSSNNLLAWTSDPLVAGVSGNAMASGITYLAAVYLPAQASVTKIFFQILTVGVTPVAGQNYTGIYDTSGVLKASVGIDSVVTTLGLATMTFGAVTLPAGMYWVAALFNAATGPQIMRASTTANPAINVNLTTANYRFASNGTARTALAAPITVSANSVTSPYPYWCAIA